MVLLFAAVVNPAPQLVAVNACELSHDRLAAPLLRLKNADALADELRPTTTITVPNPTISVRFMSGLLRRRLSKLRTPYSGARTTIPQVQMHATCQRLKRRKSLKKNTLAQIAEPRSPHQMTFLCSTATGGPFTDLR
jgi:hypothetical protein